MKEKIFLQRYTKYSKEIQEYMKYIYDLVMEKYGAIYEHYLVSLDTLAMNLDIMLLAKKDFDERGFHHKDQNNLDRKSGAVQVFNTAQQAALKIMNQFGLNPISQSRLEKTSNKSERLLEEYVDDLTGE